MKNNNIDKTKALEEHQKMVFFQAHKFKPTPVTDFNDYCQTGTLGLLKCVDKFDSTKNVKLSSYSYLSIFREINNNQVKKMNKKIPTETITDNIAGESDDESIWEVLPDTLTKAERECVELLSKKYKIRDIAKEMKIRHKDVKENIRSAIEKIGVANGE